MTTRYTIHDYGNAGIALTTTDTQTADVWARRGKHVTAVTTA